jgi:hypothetical protein
MREIELTTMRLRLAAVSAAVGWLYGISLSLTVDVGDGVQCELAVVLFHEGGRRATNLRRK